MIDLSLPFIQQFLLVLLRVAAFVAMFPVFGGEGVPMQVKAALSFVLTLVLYPVVRHTIGPQFLPTSVLGLAAVAASELTVGFVLGLSVRLLLSGAELAGHMVGYQMGFGIISVIDPQSGGESSLMAEFTYLAAILVFLAVNGHHIFLRAMVSSFEMVPPGTLTLKDGLYRLLLRDSAQMFALGVKIGAPAIAALIFTTLAFALLARAVPQFNVLIAGFPVSIAVGLIFFGLSLQLSLPLVAREVRGLDVGLSRLLKAM